MKSLSSIFPNASKSFFGANPQLPPIKRWENAVRGNLGSRKGKSKDNETPNRSEIPNSELECHQTPALDSADAGEEKSLHRTVVRFIGYRVRPLDPDNFAGGCKDLLDGLRHAGIIQGDEPWRIIFETTQEKVKTYAEERTVIEIETPPVPKSNISNTAQT